jgi:flagellar hook-associated protein 3 FlgL
LENQVRTANSAGITSSINNLDVARERIETNRISVGVKTTTVEAVRTQREVANETLSRQISLVEDADLAEASIEFNSAQTAYNATLATAARLFESSLVNYLR